MPKDNNLRGMKNFYGGILIGTIVAVLLQLGGYLMVRGGQDQFGHAMFFVVPFVSGLVVAAIVRGPRLRVTACLALSGIITLTLLIYSGMEGIICCLMALPMVVAAVAVGGVCGYYLRGRVIDKMPDPTKTTLLLLVLSPLIMAAADRIEKPYRSVEQHETFSSQVVLKCNPDQAWHLLANMRPLDGPQPFLLRAGLPVPTNCVLDAEKVGGPRVCYFNQGKIVQEVTEWKVPNRMAFKISESTLPGRHWLKFVDASYELKAQGTNTVLIRNTTIGTRLYPRWYWRPLEEWGVTSEHEFVLANLERWAEGK